MTKKSTVIALAAVILTASAFGFTRVTLASTTTRNSPSSWKLSQKHIKDYLKNAPGVMGTVESITGTAIVINGKNNIRYNIDATGAKIFKNRNTVITITDIKIGDTIMAQGTVSGTSVTATTIFDGKTIGGKKHHGNFPGVMGVVSNLNLNTMTFSVTGKDDIVYTITTTPETKIMKGSSSVNVHLDKIANTDTVMVRGTVSGQNIIASAIFDGEVPHHKMNKNPISTTQQ